MCYWRILNDKGFMTNNSCSKILFLNLTFRWGPSTAPSLSLAMHTAGLEYHRTAKPEQNIPVQTSKFMEQMFFRMLPWMCHNMSWEGQVPSRAFLPQYLYAFRDGLPHVQLEKCWEQVPLIAYIERITSMILRTAIFLCIIYTEICINAPPAGRDKTPVHLPRATEFLCGANRFPRQLSYWASKAAPETLKWYTFTDFTLRYLSLSEDDCLLSEERHLGKNKLRLGKWI